MRRGTGRRAAWVSFGVGLAILVVAVLTTAPITISGESMSPAIQNGDLLVMSTIAYDVRLPDRGDIVVLKDPANLSNRIVKRVVGLPGESILIRAFAVYVDGVRLEEPYLKGRWALTPNWPDVPDSRQGEVIPPAHYFVLGDNRDHSDDSRVFGAVPLTQVVGEVVLRLVPVERIGPV